ncbi:hypothetical protein ACF0H5_012649 [Mactra antiquata]
MTNFVIFTLALLLLSTDVNCGKDKTYKKLEKRVDELEQMLKENIRMRKTPNIAFRSALGNTVNAMNHGSSVVFDIVGLNNGNAYDSDTGKFTAPVNGVYLFSMKIGNPTSKPGNFALVKASSHGKKFLEYAFGGHTSGWSMGGTTTVTQLVKGDSVWVEGEGTASGIFHGSWRMHTTFAGALLYEV